MKKAYCGLMSLLLLGLFSCAKEETASSVKGRISVSMSADQSLLGEQSRGSVSGETPDVNDFSLSIVSEDEDFSSSWDRFADFEPVVVDVGTYTVTASYGNADTEGFDALSYLGSTTVDVKKNEVTDASILCSINKAKVSITYTEDFQTYFSSYSAYINTSKGNKVSYLSDEIRGAYFVPGDLSVYLEVTRQGNSQKITLNPKNFTAEVKHEYRLTMDVDASTASLKIIFNDNPLSEENVDINISDEALSAAPPVFTPYGFSSGTAIEVSEYGSVSEKLEAYLNAPAGLARCELITQSEALKTQGWPESVDLMNLTAEQSQKLAELGLATRGLGANHDKIATIDFQNVIPHLYCVSGQDEEHVFTLKATDLYSKVSEDLVLKVLTHLIVFDVQLPASVPYGSSVITFPLTLEGDVAKVQFYYDENGIYKPFDSAHVSVQPDGDNQYTVTLTYPNSLTDTENGVKFKAAYGAKAIERIISVEAPTLQVSLKNGKADVWATKVDMQVTDLTQSLEISAETVEFQYKKDGVWTKWDNVSLNGMSQFTLKGLSAGATYTIRAAHTQGLYSNELEITTEQATQLPNAGMEEWFSNKIAEDGTDLSGNSKVYWNKWYPWNESINTSKGWSTVNQTTTQYGATPSTFLGFPTFPYVGCCYTTNSGTLRTDNHYEGSYAALIRTVGWGHDNQADGRDSQNVTPGELYLGSYDVSTHTPIYGYDFTSRPTGLAFYYQYVPKNEADYWEVQIEVKDAEGQNIASQRITRSGNVSEYTKEVVPLTYGIVKKAASISVIFRSSANPDCLVSNETNLSYPKFGNLSDGEYVGSQLYIDNIELIYE